MGNIFKDDFRDFIESLNIYNFNYILVGGFSVILHGHERTTGDMDLWVERMQANYKKLVLAFLYFGMRVFDMREDVFLNDPVNDVFTFGRPPTAIDIMVAVKGVDFKECFKRAVFFEQDGLKIRTIHISDLIVAKNASGRHKDLDDLEHLMA